MRNGFGVFAAVVVLAVTIGGCSTNGDEGSATLRQLQARTEQIGDDLLARLDGQLEDDQVAPESGVRSDGDDDASLDHGRRYRVWHARVGLARGATRSPEQEVRALADHLVADGWTEGTPTPPAPDRTSLRMADDLGPDWLVQMTPIDGPPGLVDITVVSPVTSRD